MKKSLIIILILFSGTYVKAQSPGNIRFNAYGSYNFNERVPIDAFYTDVQGGFQWGAGLEYFVRRNKSLELKYLRMDTKTPLFRNINGEQVNKGNDDAAFNYIMLAGNNYFGGNGKITPFAGIGLGVGWAEGNTNSSGAKFVWDAKLGVHIATESAVSFKVQAYVQSMISAFGTDFWYYPGWGTYAVADYARVFQFGLGGAVCFDFKKK
jgi:opacity protein-like surface antigen